MGTSSAQLGQLIEQAAANLGQVDERLTGSTQSFAATTEKAAQTFASSARLVDSEHDAAYRAVVLDFARGCLDRHQVRRAQPVAVQRFGPA